MTELDKSSPQKATWDEESFSMLRFLIINGCRRSLAEKFLNRSNRNVYSKIQKQVILLRSLIEAISEAIRQFETHGGQFQSILKFTLETGELEKYLVETKELLLFIERQRKMNHFPTVADDVLKITCSSKKETEHRRNLCNQLKATDAYSVCQNFIPVLVSNAKA